MKTLGDRLRETRKEKRLTQAQLAKASGVSRPSISQWEQEINQPRGESLIALAKALDCEPDWLLSGDATLYLQKKGRVTRVQPADNPPEARLVSLDFYDVEVSAGHGALVLKEEQVDSITFSRTFIDNTLGVNAKNVFLMPVRGDSMVPTLKNQAIIMVNRIEEFSGDGVYVFRFDGQLMVKRLQFSKTGLTVVSDNRDYKEWELTRNELTTEDFKIIGEVVWAGQRM